MGRRNRIIVNLVMNNITVWVKNNPLLPRIAGVIVILTFLLLTIPQICSCVKNTIYPSNIYLVLSEWDIPLNLTWNPVNLPIEIEEDKPFFLRFGLVQNNFNSPQITKILVTFPPQANVKTVGYKRWTWQRNNDDGLTYFLDYPVDDPAVKGIRNELPAFEVILSELDKMEFRYSIYGDKIEPITRMFIINQGIGQDNTTLRTTLLGNIDDSNSATPCVVRVAHPSDIKQILKDVLGEQISDRNE